MAGSFRPARRAPCCDTRRRIPHQPDGGGRVRCHHPGIGHFPASRACALHVSCCGARPATCRSPDCEVAGRLRIRLLPSRQWPRRSSRQEHLYSEGQRVDEAPRAPSQHAVVESPATCRGWRLEPPLW